MITTLNLFLILFGFGFLASFAITRVRNFIKSHSDFFSFSSTLLATFIGVSLAIDLGNINSNELEVSKLKSVINKCLTDLNGIQPVGVRIAP